MKTNQLKENKMLEMKTTYQSKNWNKRLKSYCKENRRKKAIKQLKFVSNFVKQTFKNMEKNDKTKTV